MAEGSEAGRAHQKFFTALRRLLTSSLLLLMILIAGYALAPLVGLLSAITIPIYSLQLSTVILLIIAALFIYSLLDFVKAFLNFLRLPQMVLNHFPTILPKSLNTATRFFLNLTALILILILYWVFSPFLYLIPRIGEQIAAVMQLVVAAVVAIFFWNLGRTVYRSLDRMLSRRIEEQPTVSSIIPLKTKVLKTFIYIMLTMVVLIIAYALLPAISLGANTQIPGTTLTLGTLYWVIALSIVVLSLFSLLRNLLAVFRIGYESLSKIIPLDVRRLSRLRSVALNFILVTAIVILFFIISPYITIIPDVGAYLAAAGQVMVGAVLILFFWDVGRTIYVELEDAFRKIEEVK